MSMSDQVSDDEISILMEERVKSVEGYYGNCGINKIPAFIQKGKEVFYRPSVVSIGPVYYNDETLKTMQELKWSYLKYFLQHRSNANRSLKHYTKYVKDHEKMIRNCYEERISVPSKEFIQMIVLDAAFIIYLFLTNSDFAEHNMPLPGKQQQQGLAPYVLKDLLLLENQLPYFVLQGFFDLAFGPLFKRPNYAFESITLQNIMHVSFPGFEAIMASVTEVKGIMDSAFEVNRIYPSVVEFETSLCPKPVCITHLVDLLRKCCFSHAAVKQQKPHDEVCYPSTAKKLSDNGVKFEVISDSKSPLDITFMKGKFMISELVLDTDTEFYLRNLLYFEQCHYYPFDSRINDYMLFLDKLIDTVEDVQVLQEAGILKNHLGSDEDAIKFFNNVPRITVGVGNQFYYSEVSKKANKYASSSWNKWIVLFWRKYFSHPWAIISVFAAIILFILTLLQTIAAYNE